MARFASPLTADMNAKNNKDTAGFSRRLKQRMADNGIRLKDIAAATGKSVAAAHKWTHGGDIDHVTLRSLASYLDVNWVWLRYGDEAVQEVLANYQEIDASVMSSSQWTPGKALRQQIRALARAVGWEWDIYAGCLFSTPDAAALFGRPVMTIDDFLQCIHPGDRERLQDGLTAMLANDSVYEADCRIDLPDGGGRWLAHRCRRITDATGRAIKVIGASMDISHRKQTEMALLEQRQQLELSLSLFQLNAWELDLETWAWTPDKSGLKEIHDSLLWRFGSRLPATFLEFINHVHPDDRTQIVRAIRMTQQTGAAEIIEFRIQRPGQPVRRLKSRLRALPDTMGPTRIIGVTTDITEQKNLESRLISKRRRLELALEAAGLSEWQLDLETGEVICSDLTARILGFSSAAAVQTEEDFLGAIHAEDRQRVRAVREEALTGPGRYRITYRVVLPGGQLRYIRETAIFSTDAAGYMRTYFGAICEI